MTHDESKLMVDRMLELAEKNLETTTRNTANIQNLQKTMDALLEAQKDTAVCNSRHEAFFNKKMWKTVVAIAAPTGFLSSLMVGGILLTVRLIFS